MNKITETDSIYRHLDKMTTSEILTNMNKEDQKVALAVEKQIPAIGKLVDSIVPKMAEGGRLFYIGAGTSGRLGVLDASECPPTFGVPFDWVVGIIAGGDTAIRKSVEDAEDDLEQAIRDLDEFQITELDTVVGIAASGTTPYVIGGLRACQERGIATGCIVCNPGAPIINHADFPIVIQVGPEFVTGSTRMKSGTAQKLALNMISTSVMIKLGRVVDNKMVDMQLSNSKLIDRGTKMVMKLTGLGYEAANKALMEHGSVRAAAEKHS
ncbi:N-acetylmuramic acid 6-phosphate etherase [Portibacter lacus]|uniref:N-acetylmuramic acid 6-phosphate etherase n=1 Tax=Portibacter lacus TaxID=1099794 RepID=A0AA37WCS8_9BACT|nr:N-acetylmuramic acid 6-phosphate etherase [Portibacter lacus]GLR16811.1 N-acetylmuramic acid 6-phosphate etherase [Portibacter lacus]